MNLFAGWENGGKEKELFFAFGIQKNEKHNSTISNSCIRFGCLEGSLLLYEIMKFLRLIFSFLFLATKQTKNCFWCGGPIKNCSWCIWAIYPSMSHLTFAFLRNVLCLFDYHRWSLFLPLFNRWACLFDLL